MPIDNFMLYLSMHETEKLDSFAIDFAFQGF